MNPSSDHLQASALPIQPPEISAQKSSAPKSKKKIILVALLGVFVALAGTLGIYLSHNTVRKLSVTLYYSDGKTVLWQDNTPAVEPKTQPAKAPYFVDLIRTELRETYGEAYYKQGAWQVTTTLDANLQAKAEKLVADNLPNVTRLTNGKADAEATILEDVSTGQIKALVGGPDRSNAQYGLINFATTVRVEPGSSIKPLDYAALIENTTNTGAGSVVNDTQGPLFGYPCTSKLLPQAGGNCLEDYDLQYAGAMPLRYALGGHRNVPAVQAAVTVGVQKFISTVNNMGADSGYKCYLDQQHTQPTACFSASALGDGAFLTLADETHVLATLANNGKKLPQTTIAAIRLNGKVKLASSQPASQQILKPDTAYIINDIMSDPNASYLPGSCTATTCAEGATSYKFQRYNGWKFAVDSGTTTNGQDSIMASWSSRYAVVSWVGNHTQTVNIQQAATGATSEALTTPLTRGLMEAAHAGKSPTNWTQPADIQTLPAFVLTNHIHYGDVEPSPAADLYPAWYKP